jgi:hypothetical protein
MKEAELNKWKKRTRHLTKQDLLDMASLFELRTYEKDIPAGPVLDIGVGLGCDTLYYAEKKRQVVALDKETYFLERIQKISGNNPNIVTVKSKLPKGPLPQNQYALIVLSNILHFFSLEDGKKLCKRISPLLQRKGYLMLRVHSSKHPYADCTHKKNKHFNHFFSEKEVTSLFPEKKFETIYFSDCRRKFSNAEIEIMGLQQELVKEKAGYILLLKKR